jgi:hypothetical protein
MRFKTEKIQTITVTFIVFSVSGGLCFEAVREVENV